MSATSIEWTDAVWNATRGCSRVSPGCDNCYAMRQAHRFDTPEQFEDQDLANGIRELSKRAGPYHGLTIFRETGPRRGVDWSGVVRIVPEMLDVPLRWRKPQKIFVNSMSDLFHESLSNEEIAAVFGVMAACPQHTFQVLTKRAERMREWFEWVHTDRGFDHMQAGKLHDALCCAMYGSGDNWDPDDAICEELLTNANEWPLPNIWLGVSAEDQQRADERIPHLLETPAAVRFVSAEPLLGPVDLRVYLREHACDEWPKEIARGPDGCAGHPMSALDWIIGGGESGSGARPFDLAWARDLRDQCKAAGVPFFFKQAGSRPYDSNVNCSDYETLPCVAPPPGVTGGAAVGLKFDDRKGGDLAELPYDLRVREFPR